MKKIIKKVKRKKSNTNNFEVFQKMLVVTIRKKCKIIFKIQFRKESNSYPSHRCLRC